MLTYRGLEAPGKSWGLNLPLSHPYGSSQSHMDALYYVVISELYIVWFPISQSREWLTMAQLTKGQRCPCPLDKLSHRGVSVSLEACMEDPVSASSWVELKAYSRSPVNRRGQLYVLSLFAWAFSYILLHWLPSSVRISKPVIPI